MRINIIANSMVEPGMSGGNRIFIELAKKWQKKGVKIRVFTSDVGKDICQTNGLKADFIVWQIPRKKQKYSTIELLGLYFLALFRGALNISRKGLGTKDIVYSSSDYWPDLLPAVLAKLFKNCFWMAGFFLIAPKPWQENSPYKNDRLLGWLYWLTQLPAYFVVKKWANLVFVTSQPDQIRFVTKIRLAKQVLVVRGGVDIKKYKKVKKASKQKYHAVFVGRLHPQKGVLELIDIWQRVVQQIPEAKLVIIGDGPLNKDLRFKIKDSSLEKNIILHGFLDGQKKIRIIRQSKIVIHPAIYDSGGMAPIEAMAIGLPGVSFDLPALKTYYPQGMVKTPCFDQNKFAQNIVTLLGDKNIYFKMSKQAIKMAKQWGWPLRANEVLKIIKKYANK